MNEYYEEAQAVNEVWSEGIPQWLLRQQIHKGMRLLDLGCGSGHAFENLRNIGPVYTGVDWSEQIIKRNREIHEEEATFLVGSIYDTQLPSNNYDMVFSLYVLEHLVWPHIFLSEMVRLAKPGGLIFVVCPNYRPYGRMPSLWYGIPSSLKQKLRTEHFFDAMRHAALRSIYYPFMIKTRYPLNEYPFLINLSPSCLNGHWHVDTDAVYFVDRREVASELCWLGTKDITSELLGGSMPELVVNKSLCLIVARKS
jgi:ubiquinone/menaquinone biosynthesis C-methylase UbiE